MTATTIDQVRTGRRTDITHIPLSRVVRVELRKMFDTRSGFWLMMSVAIAAVLAAIVKEVYTIEIIKELADQSKKLLAKLGYKNVQVIIGDGYKGLKEKAPFDAIIVTAAAENIPDPLIAQLKEGGRMVIPVGAPGTLQTLLLIEKIKGKIKAKSVKQVLFVPFTRPKK